MASAGPSPRTRQPRCGVAALHEPQHRLPSADERPASEYDVPWDSRWRDGAPALVGRPASVDSSLADAPPVDSARAARCRSVCHAVSVDSAAPPPPPSPKPRGVNRSTSAQRKFRLLPSDSVKKQSRPAIKPDCSPRLETTFCGKAVAQSPLVAAADEKNRRIQEIAHSDKPQPAVRRSLLKNRCRVRAEEKDARLSAAVAQVAAPADPEQQDGYDVPWEFCSKRKLERLAQLKEQQLQPSSSRAEEATALDRGRLSLNFGCAGLNPTAADFDAALPLQAQSWYHGCITRAESEARLLNAQEGSYLVRISESNRDEYALSIKSAKGFMHLKIQANEQRLWVLGYFGHPFESIPVMIRYYSRNKLPIKGAEHICLLYPVQEWLL